MEFDAAWLRKFYCVVLKAGLDQTRVFQWNTTKASSTEISFRHSPKTFGKISSHTLLCTYQSRSESQHFSHTFDYYKPSWVLHSRATRIFSARPSSPHSLSSTPAPSRILCMHSLSPVRKCQTALGHHLPGWQSSSELQHRQTAETAKRIVDRSRALLSENGIEHMPSMTSPNPTKTTIMMKITLLVAGTRPSLPTAQTAQVPTIVKPLATVVAPVHRTVEGMRGETLGRAGRVAGKMCIRADL